MKTTLLACHLFKACQLWTDLGFGEYTLHYVRDKGGKHEVDFLVAKDDQPWMLVECKNEKSRRATRSGFMVYYSLTI